MKQTLVLYSVVALLGCGIFMQRCVNNELRTDRARLERNQAALLSDIEVVKDNYDREVTKVAALELSKKELATINDDLTKRVDALNLKVKRLQGIVESVSQTTDSVVIRLDPPVEIPHDSLPPIIQRPFHFEDKYSKIWGDITLGGGDDILNLHYTVTDTLDVIIYRTPKRFLFIPYGIKKLDCYLYPRNPHSTVVSGTCIIRKSK